MQADVFLFTKHPREKKEKKQNQVGKKGNKCPETRVSFVSRWLERRGNNSPLTSHQTVITKMCGV